MRQPTHILITGASSGIGKALAVHYAARGIRLVVTGRDAERLHETARLAEARGALVIQAVADVTDKTVMQELIETQNTIQPIDLIIANAGISAGPTLKGESAEQTRAIFATNVDGVLNTCLPALPQMVARKSGQIAIISSLAGLRGLPNAPAYSASKVAVRGLAEAWRPLYAKNNIQINSVLPGFVESGITARNSFTMPFLLTGEKAAQRIADGLAANKARIAFPWQLYLPALLISLLPQAIGNGIFRLLPQKDSGRL